MKDPFLQLVIVSGEIWNNKKGLQHSNHKKREFERIKKDIDQLEKLIPLLNKELEMLQDINAVVKKYNVKIKPCSTSKKALTNI